MPKPKFRFVNPPLNATVGVPYYYHFSATNKPTFGAKMLPPGLTINPTTGVLSGTPTAAGAYDFTVTATNAAGSVSVGPFHMVVSVPNQAPVFTAASPPLTATVGVPYSYDFNATGTPAPTFSAS